MIRALITAAAIFLISTFPATWLLMLFIGNLAPGAGLSYWGTLPAGILMSMIVAGVGGGSSAAYSRR